MRDFLRARLPERVPVDEWLARGRFVDTTGTAIRVDAPYTPATFVWFHKDLPAEPRDDTPGRGASRLTVLHRDDRIVVIDKPHFVATIPRGAHVRESALVRLRLQLGLPDLAPAHRLDRLTAGVLLFTTEPRWRAAYQGLFEQRLATKGYEALAPAVPSLAEPTWVRSHIVKRRGSLQAVEIRGEEPNAETLVTLTGLRGDLGLYRLGPRTGRTHQLRVHMASVGAPIAGDPLYPVVSESPEDATRPLRLVARSLEFSDPVDGSDRRFTSTWPLVP